MGDVTKDGQAKNRKTPEEIRADRIAAVTDPKTRQEIDEIVKARDAKLIETIDRQKETLEKRVAVLAEKKMRNADGPHLTPPGMQLQPYIGKSGLARAESDARAQIQTSDHKYRQVIATPYNRDIDHRLDAHERDHAETRRESPSPEQTPRRLVKFEDRFPDAAKREITR